MPFIAPVCPVFDTQLVSSYCHFRFVFSWFSFYFVARDRVAGRVVNSLNNEALKCREFTCSTHWPQYMDSWLARICILVNACHRKPLDSHFTPVKTLDRHTDLCTYQCMKCNRWQVFSFKFHENSEKKNGKVPQIFKSLRYLLKIAKKICCFVQY